jgi:hypothetical protein
LGPLLSVEYNIDDGVFLGGGLLIKRHGFRKEPFAMKHEVKGNYAINTSSFNIIYRGTFTDVFKGVDLTTSFDVKAPRFVYNFFGLGNETQFQKFNKETSKAIQYYRIRAEQVYADLLLSRKINKNQRVAIGPSYYSVKIQNREGRFVSEFNLDNQELFKLKQFAGGSLQYFADFRDNDIVPQKGLLFSFKAGYYKGLNSYSKDYADVHGDISLYKTIFSRITISNRIGGGHTFGGLDFFQGQTLGGPDNLRGYRKTRFHGRSAIYNNFEVRAKLFSFSTYLFPGSFGVSGFYDMGRVWYDNQTSGKLHAGTGPGIWVTPAERIALAFYLTFSEEEILPLVKAGFYF